MASVILYYEKGKVHGVYTAKNKRKAFEDNDLHFRGRGFVSGEINEDEYSETPIL